MWCWRGQKLARLASWWCLEFSIQERRAKDGIFFYFCLSLNCLSPKWQSFQAINLLWNLPSKQQWGKYKHIDRVSTESRTRDRRTKEVDDFIRCYEPITCLLSRWRWLTSIIRHWSHSNLACCSQRTRRGSTISLSDTSSSGRVIKYLRRRVFLDENWTSFVGWRDEALLSHETLIVSTENTSAASLISEPRDAKVTWGSLVRYNQ